jgi:RIO kinase 1
MDENKIDRLWQKKDKQRQKKKRKTEEHAATGQVFDKYTLENLNRLRSKGVIAEFVGIISAGKEANVYLGYDEYKKPLAIKIYKIDPQNVKWMKNYIIGDPRFKKIGSSTHKIIYTWAKKEFKNLLEMRRKGIRVPEPINCIDNILIMEFIGDSNGSPAPRLKDIDELKNPQSLFDRLVMDIQEMYLKAHLVHGDLSEYNILYWEEERIIIDVSQAVSIFHNESTVYLERDIKNMISFFSHFIADKMPKPDEIIQRILQEYKNR